MLHIQRARLCKTLQDDYIQTNSCIKTPPALPDAGKLKWTRLTQLWASQGRQVKSLFFNLERMILMEINGPITNKQKKANYNPRLIPELHELYKNSARQIVPDILRGLDHKCAPALIPSVLYKPAAVL